MKLRKGPTTKFCEYSGENLGILWREFLDYMKIVQKKEVSTDYLYVVVALL
jgi:hypothetical protein